MRPLITRRELSLQLGIESQTLAVWAAKGFGPPVVKIGSKAMYDPADIERFIESRKRASTSEVLQAVAL